MTLAPPRAMTGQQPPSSEHSPPRESGVVGSAAGPVNVTGVLVVHDGAEWLRECLDALALQARPPDRLVIVDTGSVDESREIVAEHGRIRQVIGDVVPISAPRESRFGEAVGRAVDQLPVAAGCLQAATGGDLGPGGLSGDPGPGEWLWLLHDDSAADPQVLAHLLDAVRRSPSVGVAGPKLTIWADPSRLLQVGQQVTHTGGRAGGPATGEPDQGQHDHRGDVLSVNTSGMLIRREVFDALGGFDPGPGQFGDGLALCWRAPPAGHRLVAVPRAPSAEDKYVGPSLDPCQYGVRQSGGTIEKLDLWGRRRLAYAINKKSEGIYAVVDITAEPSAVIELDRQLNLNEAVLRTKVLRPDTR